jgi:hypothetical protein
VSGVEVCQHHDPNVEKKSAKGLPAKPKRQMSSLQFAFCNPCRHLFAANTKQLILNIPTDLKLQFQQVPASPLLILPSRS